MPPATLWLGLCRLSSGLPGPLALSPQERARLDRIGAPSRAAQYRLGRWLLRHLAAQATGVEFGGVALNAEGRPQAFLSPGLGVPRLSLAHSGDWVLGAACFGPCGVDLERRAQSRDWAALAEHLGLDPGEATEDPVLRHWTLKEALYKAAASDQTLAVWRWDSPD
ncbi:MAG: 4'-phosphopantetheinyl transferase family protein, partial [bacterium]